MSEQPQQAQARDYGKNKRSSVYIYLVILFGAAFLMLLLAYFVQLRNNAAVQDDLRTTNASRQELLEDIRRLEEEKSQLSRQMDELRRDLEEQIEEYYQENIDLSHQRRDANEQLSSWESFWALEQSYQAKNYEDCAAILLLEGFSYRIPEGAQARHEEIVQAIVDRGFLAEDYRDHSSDYEELIDAYLERQTNR